MDFSKTFRNNHCILHYAQFMKANIPKQVSHLYIYQSIEENIKMPITKRSICAAFSGLIQLLFLLILWQLVMHNV